MKHSRARRRDAVGCEVRRRRRERDDVPRSRAHRAQARMGHHRRLVLGETPVRRHAQRPTLDLFVVLVVLVVLARASGDGEERVAGRAPRRRGDDFMPGEDVTQLNLSDDVVVRDGDASRVAEEHARRVLAPRHSRDVVEDFRGFDVPVRRTRRRVGRRRRTSRLRVGRRRRTFHPRVGRRRRQTRHHVLRGHLHGVETFRVGHAGVEGDRDGSRPVEQGVDVLEGFVSNVRAVDALKRHARRDARVARGGVLVHLPRLRPGPGLPVHRREP